MKKIELSKQGGRNKENFVALVDDGDYEFLNQWRWYVLKGRNTYYAAREIKINNKQAHIYMHRILLNPKTNEYIDHIDHNGLNNQRNNIRICTAIQNGTNRYPNKNIHYKGIQLMKHCKKNPYKARITKNKKLIYLSLFPTEIEAALAYDKAALEYFGEFANLNFK